MKDLVTVVAVIGLVVVGFFAVTNKATVVVDEPVGSGSGQNVGVE